MSEIAEQRKKCPTGQRICLNPQQARLCDNTVVRNLNVRSFVAPPTYRHTELESRLKAMDYCQSKCPSARYQPCQCPGTTMVSQPWSLCTPMCDNSKLYDIDDRLKDYPIKCQRGTPYDEVYERYLDTEKFNQLYQTRAFDLVDNLNAQFESESPVCYNHCIRTGKRACMHDKSLRCADYTALRHPLLFQTHIDMPTNVGLNVGPYATYQTLENIWNNNTSRKLL